ncbi:MAG: SDR family oxidoreductase [Planctomycetaceae bacterium]|jgi:NAD(P)-dependent dehydrogenase (short-subunit alcohol dehydrogenase family)|nr:SDR family oxidoreductase [Planctomycetaceae bacterium]
MKQQKSPVAVITGAGGTLCSEMAYHLSQQGFRVALLGRRFEKLETVRNKIMEHGGEAMSLSVDVTDADILEKSATKIIEAWGLPHVLINGAGGNQEGAITTQDEFDPAELNSEDSIRGFFNLKPDVFRNVLEVNTMGTVLPCQIFGRAMARLGEGCIINIASMNSFKPLSRVPAYGMAKAGIVNLTQWLAVYLAPAGIRVNAIAPGFFLNDRNRSRLLTPDGVTERGANILRQTPLKKFGEASELLGCVDWLINDTASGFVTGIVIPVDGGFLACSGI